VITCHLYRDGKLEDGHLDPETIRDHLQHDGPKILLDIEDPTEADRDLLERQFGFHPLTIEATRERGQRPKLEIFDTYSFLVVHALRLEGETDLVDSEVHVLFGKGFMVTLRYAPAFDLARVKERLANQEHRTEEGGAFLLYLLLDEIVDGYFDVIERLEDLGDDIEARVFADTPDQEAQEDIFKMKRVVVRFRRLTVPLREALDRALEDPEFVTSSMAPYYRDVLDHVIRVSEFTDNLRDLLTSALEAQLTQISNRVNQVMKSLTSWGAIILVPTLIAGIYGMNFEGMPELHWAVGYPLALGLMVASAIALYVTFRRKGWL
jgi:magnesium transporter